MRTDLQPSIATNRAETVRAARYRRLVWESFRRALSEHRETTAALRLCRLELQKTEKRIGLLGELLAVDGVAVQVPVSCDESITKRLRELLSQ